MSAGDQILTAQKLMSEHLDQYDRVMTWTTAKLFVEQYAGRATDLGVDNYIDLVEAVCLLDRYPDECQLTAEEAAQALKTPGNRGHLSTGQVSIVLSLRSKMGYGATFADALKAITDSGATYSLSNNAITPSVVGSMPDAITVHKSQGLSFDQVAKSGEVDQVANDQPVTSGISRISLGQRASYIGVELQGYSDHARTDYRLDAAIEMLMTVGNHLDRTEAALAKAEEELMAFYMAFTRNDEESAKRFAANNEAIKAIREARDIKGNQEPASSFKP